MTYVGVGDLGENPPLLQDGFISRKELQILNKAGAVGEIVGWAFDAEGRLIEGLTNDRVASVKLDVPAQRLVDRRLHGRGEGPGARRGAEGQMALRPHHRRAHGGAAARLVTMSKT